MRLSHACRIRSRCLSFWLADSSIRTCCVRSILSKKKFCRKPGQKPFREQWHVVCFNLVSDCHREGLELQRPELWFANRFNQFCNLSFNFSLRNSPEKRYVFVFSSISDLKQCFVARRKVVSPLTGRVRSGKVHLPRVDKNNHSIEIIFNSWET